jgi:hypothetical protein
LSEYADIEAIKQLKARYFRLMDTKDWDGMAQVFIPDVEIDVTEEGSGTFHSVEVFMPYLQSVIGDAVTVHHGHMPEIELTSPTTASGIWSMEDMLRWPEGGPEVGDDGPLSTLHGYGHYHETYVKTNDGWRIASLRLTRLRRDIGFLKPGD